jgi:hypothetical protein
VEVPDLAGSDSATRFRRTRAVLPGLPGPREVGCFMSVSSAAGGLHRSDHFAAGQRPDAATWWA